MFATAGIIRQGNNPILNERQFCWQMLWNWTFKKYGCLLFNQMQDWSQINLNKLWLSICVRGMLGATPIHKIIFSLRLQKKMYYHKYFRKLVKWSSWRICSRDHFILSLILSCVHNGLADDQLGKRCASSVCPNIGQKDKGLCSSPTCLAKSRI